MKGNIPALVKAVAEELGPQIDKVVPVECSIKVGIYGSCAISARSAAAAAARGTLAGFRSSQGGVLVYS